MQTRETIGFIGLGLMGRPMAKNLLKAGFPLVVHSRSQGPVADLVSAGASRAESPREIAGRSTRIITMLPDSPDVELVLEGRDGVFSAMQAGTILIDTSSIAPEAARRLAGRAAALGATMLDAPVSGGEIGGTLSAVSEAFALARKAGVDAARVREALLGGFAASRVLEVHGERILQSNYKPGFRANLFAKDMRIAGATLAQHQMSASVSAAVQQLVEALVAAGHGDDDYSALATVVFERAGIPSA